MEVKKGDHPKRKNPKRKKRSSITIEGNNYYLFHIHWEDIVGDSSLANIDDFAKMRTTIVTTLAYIFKQDDNYLYTFASYSQDNFFGDRNIIPLGNVKKVEKISL